MKKEVCIIGPIGDFGGREIETKIIAQSLEKDFNVKIVSTAYMTESSFALQKLSNTSWFSLNKEFHNSYFIIRLFSFLSKKINKGKNKTYAYAVNSITNKIYDIDELFWKLLKQHLKNASHVILCMQLTSKFLKEIVEFCFENNIPCYIRTTGTIKTIDVSKFDFLKKVTKFIHHSERNASSLNVQINLPYEIIDQCALDEEKLLKLESEINKEITFGYLGRLTNEKGILQFLQNVSLFNLNLIIAGEGNLKEEILNLIVPYPNIKYIGKIENEDLDIFFKNIDVIIIPSIEESGPLVGLEAMAAAKLIVSTDVGAMKDRLEGMESFWFDIDNYNSFEVQKAKLQSLEISEINEKKILNRERYLKAYSKKNIELKHLTLVQNKII